MMTGLFLVSITIGILLGLMFLVANLDRKNELHRAEEYLANWRNADCRLSEANCDISRLREMVANRDATIEKLRIERDGLNALADKSQLSCIRYADEVKSLEDELGDKSDLALRIADKCLGELSITASGIGEAQDWIKNLLARHDISRNSPADSRSDNRS